MSIRALIVEPSAPNAMPFAELPEPTAGPSQVVIELHHASLNYGDLNEAGSGSVALHCASYRS